MTPNDDYWKKKSEKVVSIALDNGYPSYDLEFWKRQPAGVISLIVELYYKLENNRKSAALLKDCVNTCLEKLLKE
jgi:hypothetical protein